MDDDDEINEAFSLACRRGMLFGVQDLFSTVDAKTREIGLVQAAEQGNTPIVKYLVSLEVDCRKTDGRGFAAIHFASMLGDLELTSFLIANGADLNVKTATQHTSLMIACSIGEERIVELLLKEGADLSQIDEEGKSALHIACSEGFDDIIRILLAHDADVNLCDLLGKTPIHYAAIARNSRPTLIRTLVNNGAQVNVQSNLISNSQTPLHLAAHNGTEDSVHALVCVGADFTVRDSNGKIPLQLAMKAEHELVCRYLAAVILDRVKCAKRALRCCRLLVGCRDKMAHVVILKLIAREIMKPWLPPAKFELFFNKAMDKKSLETRGIFDKKLKTPDWIEKLLF